MRIFSMKSNSILRSVVIIIINGWSRENGYKSVFLMAFPLILSTSSWSIQQFVDRMFLSWYSPVALAASMPAGILSFALVSLFLGTSAYTSTFIAQYMGAKRNDRVAPSMWQGVYFAVIGGILVGITFFFADPIFRFIGHEAAIQVLEITYWKYMTAGAIFPILLGAISGFFNGRGKTYPVMWTSFIATGTNIILNYTFIFGHFGFPEMGIGGAGLATVLSQIVNIFILVCLAVYGKQHRSFKIVARKRFELKLFLRLMKFGLPNGIQFFLDIVSFSMFILIIGRIGLVELAATNIVMNISMLTFMPMIGLGIAISVLVGQALGSNKPYMAERATSSGLQLSMLYTSVFVALYLIIPDIFIYPFASNADPTNFESIRQHALTAMKFVAFWAICDTIHIVVASSLKGAGDTRFIMLTTVVLSVGVLLLPTYFLLEVADKGLVSAWTVGAFYIFITAITLLVRYIYGPWRTIKVIDGT